MRPFLLRSSSGFSLVELMVALVLSAIAVIAIYRSFLALRVGIDKHEQDCEIHQNLRVGMQRMAQELRMAGYDPNGGAESGFVTTEDDQIRFTANYGYNIDEDNRDLTEFDVDLDDSGTFEPLERWADEDVTYAHVDTDADGINDSLQRTDHNDNGGVGTSEVIIPNVNALRFVYYDGANPPALLPKPVSSGFDRAKIRDVEIIMVVQATNEDFSYTNNRVYLSTADEFPLVPLGPDGAVDEIFDANGDNFRRGRMVARIKVRNAGLR